MAQDPLAALGYAQSRLQRHSAEQDESAVPSPEAAGARFVLLAGDRVVLAQPGSALLDGGAAARAPERAFTLFLGRLDGAPVFAAAIPPEAADGFEADAAYRTLDLRAIAAEGAVAAHELG